MAMIQIHDGSEVEETDLRVYRVLDTRLNHLVHDFTILGFRKVSPKYDRGRKIEAEYICAVTDDKVVKKIFSDVRNESGRLTQLQVEFQWFNELGEIGDSKIEIVKNYNEWEAQTEERKRRERQRDFLVGEADRAGAKAYLDMLFDYFKGQIDAYIETGSNAWEIAVKNHAPKFVNDDPAQGPDASAIETQIYGILEARPEGVFSIKEAILYQIAGEMPGA